MSDTFDVNRKPYLDLLLADQQRVLRPGFDYAPTPFPSWNSRSRDDGGGSGIAMGWHIVLAGNPGFGKSVLAINLAAHAAANGVAVGYVSLEMSHKQLAVRHLAIRTGLAISPMERGTSYNHVHMTEATQGLLGHSDEPFAVCDEPFHDIHDVVSLMADWKAHGVTMFIVDYMQLMGSPGVSGPEEVAHVSRAIRGFAKANKVITVGLSQFNRETSKNYEGSPAIQGLHGGMSMEADADQVLMLDHSQYQRVDDVGAMTWLLLGKNRHGPTGKIPIWLSYKNLQIRQALADEVSDWPGGDE